MKTLATLFLLFLPFLVYSQVKTVKVSEKKIGPLSCEFSHDINIETKDTTSLVIVFFQNKKYNHIRQIEAIGFKADDKEAISTFIKDLNTAIPEMGKKTPISWDKDSYSLRLSEFSPALYFGNKKGYTFIDQQQAKDLVSWLSSLGYE